MDRKWVRALPLAVAVTVIGLGVTLGFGRAEPPVVPDRVVVAGGAGAPADVIGGWKAEPSTPTSFTVADATVEVVHLFEAPGVPLAARPTMDNPTWENLAVVFLVLDESDPEWLQVRVSSRPNNLTAYVSRSEVRLRTVPNHVLIEVGARRVTVRHGDDVLLTETVAVGTDRTPTPVGHFFVDGIYDVPDDGGAYGAFQVSVSGFSDALQSFGGGVGQIAMHGTNRPELLGQPVSNGCVRMTNDAITRMAELAPPGTPVEIVA